MSMVTLSKGKHVRPPPSGLSQKESYRVEEKSTHTFGAGGVPTFENLDGSNDESLGEEEGKKMDFDLDGMEREEASGEDAEMGEEEAEEDDEMGEEEEEEESAEQVDKSWDGDNMGGHHSDEVI